MAAESGATVARGSLIDMEVIQHGFAGGGGGGSGGYGLVATQIVTLTNSSKITGGDGGNGGDGGDSAFGTPTDVAGSAGNGGDGGFAVWYQVPGGSSIIQEYCKAARAVTAATLNTVVISLTANK
ncbi:hypothetical protein HED51_20320 [Ochrobactrum grignonense]|nr:hypothetical protein [Brucella grignonensis]